MSDSVLLVDDNDADAAYLEELVQACGYEVVRARSSAEALRKLRATSFRAMILDLNLGVSVGDGFLVMDRMLFENINVSTQIVSHSADLDRVSAVASRYPFVRTRPLPKQELYVYKTFLEAFLKDSSALVVKAADSKGVFLVHGRDLQQRDRIERIVRSLGLRPIILSAQAQQGKTIIELFEQHAQNSVYAIVLLTADDVGRVQSENVEHSRARQNVIFELGFFYAKLGRDHVMCLVPRGVEKPSDIDGILYVEMDTSDHELERRIIKELQALEIDFRLE